MSATVDPHADAMQRSAGRFMPEFECRPHGRLPGDRTAPCGCFESEPCPEFMATCGFCAELSPPDVERCIGCNRKLGVTS